MRLPTKPSPPDDSSHPLAGPTKGRTWKLDTTQPLHKFGVVDGRDETSGGPNDSSHPLASPTKGAPLEIRHNSASA